MKPIKMAFVLFFISICFVGYTQHSDKSWEIRESIPLENMDELVTEIEFPVGGLIVSTTSGNAVKGIFRFNKKQWKPDIEYKTEGDRGYLDIDSESKKLKKYDESDKCIWGISLSKNVLHELDIEMGAGKCKIDLENCKIKQLDYSMAAGETDMNLRNTSIQELEFDAVVGEATIDLSGEWSNDLDAKITGGLGEITLVLPENTGIQIEISGILGSKTIPSGFSKRGDYYVNSLYKKTENTLYIDLIGGIGEIKIKTVSE